MLSQKNNFELHPGAKKFQNLKQHMFTNEYSFCEHLWNVKFIRFGVHKTAMDVGEMSAYSIE